MIATKKPPKKYNNATLEVILILVIGSITVYCITPVDTFGAINFYPTNKISIDDPQVIHLTEEDFITYPVFDAMLRNENPTFTARVVRDKNDLRNPKPFVTEPELFLISSVYSGKYVEWNGTVYQCLGYIT